MKTPRLLLLVLTAVLALLTPRPAQARVEASFDFFYDSLSPYGEWVQIADYGYCWRPTDVDPDWVPYSDGYWAFTDAGWTWVSYEDYGGIVYHYGRWVRVEDEGWCWVPDYEWGPAWVSWRSNDDYVGWAPLTPEARWQPSIGISTWVDRDCDIGPAYYSFCHTRDFGAPVLRPVIINRIENVTIIRRTVNITNITYNTQYGGGSVIYNGGPNYAFINQRSARRIPALKLVQNMNIDLAGLRDGGRGERRRNFNGQVVGNQLVVTAPFVKPPTDPGFLKPGVTKVFAADRVSRGWNGVKDEGVRQELKKEMQRQTRGLTRETAPARAVVATDLKFLPEKADPQAASPVASRDGRDRPDRKGKAPEVADQPTSPNAGSNGGRPRATAEAAPGEAMRQRQAEQAATQQQKAAQAAQTEQERATRKQGEAATQMQQQQREAQRQAEALRQQQQNEGAAAAAQQRMQAEQGRAARQQAEAAAAQQRQAEAAAAQQRRQQNDNQAGQQQRRQAAEQQRGQREANEQARRAAQEGQRQQQDNQQRQQMESQRQQRQEPRVAPPAATNTPTATPAEGDRRRKKDKDNQ